MTMKTHPTPAFRCGTIASLTITEAAEALGETRQALNNLLNGKSGVSADMPICLDKAFGGGAETSLRVQSLSSHALLNITAWPVGSTSGYAVVSRKYSSTAARAPGQLGKP